MPDGILAHPRRVWPSFLRPPPGWAQLTCEDRARAGQPDGRRSRRQHTPGAGVDRQGETRGRRHRLLSRARADRVPSRRPGSQAFIRTRQHRAAEIDRQSDHGHLGGGGFRRRGRRHLQRRRVSERRRHQGCLPQGLSSQLRRLRREALLRARPPLPHRRAGWRSHRALGVRGLLVSVRSDGLEAHHGAEVLININGSPYHYGKRAPREAMIAGRAADYGAFLAWVNTVGGQDELVFDGNSVVFDPHGRLLAHAASFVEELLVCDVDTSQPMHRPVEKLRRESEAAERLELDVTEVQVDGSTGGKAKPPIEQRLAEPLEGAAEIYAAVVLGTHDYMRKQGFEKVVIGMSGGGDSALTAADACEGLRAQHVIGVRMPSRHTSTESLDDAGLVAESLGMQLMDFSIEPPHKGFEEILAPVFRGTKPGVAEENLQPRIRSTILHALSNKFGYIVLSTGNKSELATGYGTLYGDIAGGYAVLKDITKTTVYELCRYRNSLGTAIPERVMTKPPSAELKPGQKDTDSLPPYEELDPILIGYIEDDLSPEELVAAGHRAETVARVIQLVDRSEYKRRQAPPGVKITERAFGRDRRMPIVNRYSPNGLRETTEPNSRA